MFVQHAGEPGAPPLLCLHGGTGTGAFHWGRVADSLSGRYRVHLPDLPGHGRSPLPPDGRYDGALLTGAVEELLEGMEPPVAVLAFSLGGNASLALAGKRPELFAVLALVGVSIRHHPGLDGWRTLFDPDELAAKYPLWARRLSKLHEPLGGPDAWREVCRRDAAGVELDISLPALEGLDCPVLLVRGDRDPAVDPAQYAELRAAWGERAEEFVVPAGGHDVQMTRQGVVGPVIAEFLERSGRAGTSRATMTQ